MMIPGYLSIEDAARRITGADGYPIQPRWLRRLAFAGRIPGAIRIGDGHRAIWLIPARVRHIDGLRAAAASGKKASDGAEE